MRSSLTRVICRRRAALIVSPAKSNPFREAGNSPSNSNGRGSDRKNTGPAGGRGASKPQSKTPSTTATQKKTSKIKEKPTVTISPPLEITLLEQGETEAAEEPKWGTFCNHLDGEWIGQYAAYTPWEGLPEPCWLDGNNRYVDWVYSRSVEQRGEDEEGEDRLIRKVGRAVTLNGARWLPISPEGYEAGSEDIDVEALSYNSEGVVVFNGGSYSAGPDFIGPPEFKILSEQDGEDDEKREGEKEEEEDRSADSKKERKGGGKKVKDEEDEAIRAKVKAAMREQSHFIAEDDDDDDEDEERSEAPTTTSIMEQTIVDWGNRMRMRVKATVKIGHSDQGEVDLTVLRLILFKEAWVGTIREQSSSSAVTEGGSISSSPDDSDSTTKKMAVKEAGRPKWEVDMEACPCTKLPRPTPEQACGEWSCFTISAVGIEGPKILPRTTLADQIVQGGDVTESRSNEALQSGEARGSQGGGEGEEGGGDEVGDGEQEVTWVYSSTGDKQLWELPEAQPSQSVEASGEGREEGAGSDEGGSLWLPGGVIVTFRMISMEPADPDESEEEVEEEERHEKEDMGKGNGNGKHSVLSEIEAGGGTRAEGGAMARGLCFGMTWIQEASQCFQIERFYDDKGVLREVRHMTGVKGRYKGGSM